MKTYYRPIFNNNNKCSTIEECHIDNCIVCPNGLENKSGMVKSFLMETEYKVECGLTCNQGGIYVVEGVCSKQYSGKAVHYGNRCTEHFKKSKLSSIYDHMKECRSCNNAKDFSVTYVERYLSRGKYSLSEREMLWNERNKGLINVQKTLKSS